MKELTEKQHEEVSLFISGLKGEEQRNLCPECHDKHGCGNTHSIYLHDTGVCSVCGNVNELVNCSIANWIVSQGIKTEEYWTKGKRLYNRANAK